MELLRTSKLNTLVIPSSVTLINGTKKVSGYEPKDGEGEYIPITIHCDKGSVWDVTASCWDWVTVVYN